MTFEIIVHTTVVIPHWIAAPVAREDEEKRW